MVLVILPICQATPLVQEESAMAAAAVSNASRIVIAAVMQLAAVTHVLATPIMQIVTVSGVTDVKFI